MTKSKFTPPEIVEKMYLQINNISQGFAIAILIDSLAKRFMNGGYTLIVEDIIVLLLAFSSLFISIIFWTRYYFDTYIINRSFSVRSIVWFFLYIISEGFCFRQVNEPVNWLFSTGIFLIFGFGFYVLNLSEIQRKVKNNIEINLPENDGGSNKRVTRYATKRMMKIKVIRKIQVNNLRKKRALQYEYNKLPVVGKFIIWQKQLFGDLFMLAVITFIAGGMAIANPAYLYAASPITLLLALWQLSKSREYKKYGFSNHIV